MFDFLRKNNEEKVLSDSFVEIACLLIHASRIDEKYTDTEKDIIKKTLLKFGAKENEIQIIINKAEILEKDSNQILDFTKNLKNVEQEKKILIIEGLWEIIFSDEKSDMYESNLMRRLTGLLYLDPKIVGDIKENIRSKKL
ncbi:MAG: TerB family tellurite resistance protein [Candidatus Pelagibacter sp. TMED118]|nr:MAG: TerB family tellurite resistance protein [Candidatus Pelagibacter sp. TMED118]|tara:strand:- start:53 stop:475 length:423 start_codon:yes stop_codon:yes gene_type:complete